jgi:endonuclease-3
MNELGIAQPQRAQEGERTFDLCGKILAKPTRDCIGHVPFMISDVQQRTNAVIRRLSRTYSDAHCALNHTNAFELLIATILSAQCTDARVNLVTADLFRKYRGPADYLKVPQTELERDIHSTGFFRNKSRNIQAACKRIIDNYDGEVPRTMEDILTLGGVARKTANVVLGNAFGIASGVVVDTHVARLSQRLGLTTATNAEKIEQDLQRLVPKKRWILFPHLLITHGRKICAARNPKCGDCVLNDICPSAFQIGTARDERSTRRSKSGLLRR